MRTGLPGIQYGGITAVGRIRDAGNRTQETYPGNGLGIYIDNRIGIVLLQRNGDAGYMQVGHLGRVAAGTQSLCTDCLADWAGEMCYPRDPGDRVGKILPVGGVVQPI